MTEQPFRSGFVAIVGRPNVGKSTLLNAILGEKIVITSDKPQTTRNRIQGIHTVPGGQIIFIDTPGVHRAQSRLNKALVETALDAMQGVDQILYLVEATARPAKEAELLREMLEGSTTPVSLVINKIDLLPKEELLALMAQYAQLHPFREIVPVSARNNDGVERLVDLVLHGLPEGPAYFPEEMITDVAERFIAAEIVREKVFRFTHDEIPYSVAVEVESFKERDNGVVAISATINVERDSQKGIIIGRKGEMLKRIGIEARREIERLLATKVFLELFVRVSPNWSDNPQKLKEFGY